MFAVGFIPKSFHDEEIFVGWKMKSYIITATLKTLEEVDKVLALMKKGTSVVIKEVKDDVLIITESNFKI